MLDAMMCKTCGRIKKTALTPRPHFYCDWCDPPPVDGEGNIVGTVLLWISVIILIVGAWTLLG